MRNQTPTAIPKRTANGQTIRNGRPSNGPSTPVCDGETDTKPTAKPPSTPAPKPQDTKPAANADRAASGQFAKGNRCSLGNPFARRLGALRSAFLNAVTDAEVAAVARKLADLAVSGDVQAAALFLSYAVGKPTVAMNPDALDLNEFALLDAAPTTSRVLANLVDTVDPAAAVELIRLAIMAQPDVQKHVFKAVQMRVLEETKSRVGRKAN
jgi:hypothetical protein